ncbi:MAG: hypothetical protein K940chlam9_01117 [Chlamydiae bacterium]|nr:hypothetical protein [Chlamydiota bacterium]
MEDLPALWIVDFQENLFPSLDRKHEVLERICFFLKCAKALEISVLASEQYPEGLGGTVEPLKELFSSEQKILSKTTFSGMREPMIEKEVMTNPAKRWILVGAEAHICIYQTAKDLIAKGKEVIVLNDAITSRSLYDFSTALGELRDLGARVSSSETVLYELVEDARSPLFKKVLPLIKAAYA